MYTDWGQAEWQVNGYLGAVHKKFQDRWWRAEKFVRDNCQSDNESEGGRMESSRTEALESKSNQEGWRQVGQSRNTHKRVADKARLETGPDLPPLEITTPDPSIGNSKALFSMML